MEPLPAFFISARASRMQYMVPLVLMPRMRSMSSSVTLSMGFRPSSSTPALFTSTSTLP